jgi:hypothetical protein
MTPLYTLESVAKAIELRLDTCIQLVKSIDEYEATLLQVDEEISYFTGIYEGLATNLETNIPGVMALCRTGK